MTQYNYLFIDADNTIFDYSKSEKESLKQIFNNRKINCNIDLILSNYSRINENLWKEFEKGTVSLDFLYIERFRRLLKECGIADLTESEYAKISESYLTNLSNSAYMLDGAKDMLQKLEKKFSLILITNGTSMVQRKRLKIKRIASYFNAIIISEEIGFKKPEKEFFKVAIEKSGNPSSSEILVIGDSLSSDIFGGINYGLDTCWFNPGKKENSTNILPKYEVSSFNEIYRILDIC